MKQEAIEMIPKEDLISLIKLMQKELRTRNKTSKLIKRKEFISKLTQDSDYHHKQENSKFLAIRGLSNPPHRNKYYLKPLIMQDWSCTYDSNQATGDYYVYCHVDPSERVFVVNRKVGGNYGGQPFYIGKGVGNRAYDLKRNQGHGSKIRELLSKGWEKRDIVHIAFDGLSEQKALEIESKLIYFFGTVYEASRKEGTLYNLDIPRKPEPAGTMKRQCDEVKRQKPVLPNSGESK